MAKLKLTWNLNDLLTVAEFPKLEIMVAKGIEEIGVWREKIKSGITNDEFVNLMKFKEELEVKIARLIYLPFLMESIDQKDSQARLLKTRANDRYLKYNQQIRFVERWIKGLKVDGIKRLTKIKAGKLFGLIPDLKYGLEYTRKMAKYSLAQREEEIMENMHIYGIEAINDLRGLTENDLVYELNGKKIKGQSELLTYVYSKKTEEREGAYRSLFGEHQKQIDKFFITYQAVAKSWDYEAKIRGYKSPISMRNMANQIPDEAVLTLLKVCREEKNIFGSYFKYKVKRLGQKRLNRFDLYAPIETEIASKKVDLVTAKDMVLEAFADFSQGFYQRAARVLTENHLDSHPRKNKRSGAFCATVEPGITPFVMLNYANSRRDVATLAHELGHAVHSIYANQHYPSSQQANLPLSETASTLAEMILFEKMYKSEKNRKNKKTMLAEKMAEAYATILRQNYFVLFEIEAHDRIGQGITAENLSNLYFENLAEQFGKEVLIEPIFKYEWTYISHIFESPFYCYAYNFGELLTMSLWARYLDEGRKMVGKIEKILTAGGSQNPTNVLKEIGVDINEEGFWRNGFKVIENWQKELERI